MRRAKELDADMYSKSIIDFVAIIIMLILIYDDIFGDQHREVIHDQTCKDFLYHAVLLYQYSHLGGYRKLADVKPEIVPEEVEAFKTVFWITTVE